MKKARYSRGFTLLEVLVALGVLALALSAITQSIGSSTSNIGHLKNKTYAHWVAMNVIALLQARQEFPPVGTQNGSEEMGGHEWFWRYTVAEAPMSVPVDGQEIQISNVRRVDIEVRADKDDTRPVETMMTFISRPAR